MVNKMVDRIEIIEEDNVAGAYIMAFRVVFFNCYFFLNIRVHKLQWFHNVTIAVRGPRTILHNSSSGFNTASHTSLDDCA